MIAKGLQVKGLLLLLSVSLFFGCDVRDSQSSSTEAASPVAEAAPVGLSEQTLPFTFQDDASSDKRLFETMGGGVVVFDFDGDGDLDLFFPGGGRDGASPSARTHQVLLSNDGRGEFTDVTISAGLGETEGAFAVGAAAADVDGDGDLDLFVACLGPDRLYLNEAGRFTEAPDALGADDPHWSVAPVFFDLDGDGDLDLYVADYVDYRLEDELPCTYGGVRTYCTPDLFGPAPDRLYVNEGGRFVGTDLPSGKGLAAAAFDLEGDGDLDLYVANDTTPNSLWINQDGRLTDEGLLRGGALGRDGQEKAGMGVAVFDFDRDLDHDVLVPNFSRETYDLYRQDGGFLTEVADRTGIARATTLALGFGAVAADFDFDGFTDLALAGGHINDLADELLHGETFRQPNLLLRNTGGEFQSWDSRIKDFARADVARGLAAGDFDQDGDVDLAMSRLREPSAVFVNSGSPAASWTAVKGGFGIRVVVETTTGGEMKESVAGGSYASQNEDTLRFGLGEAELKEIVVHRLDGPALTIRGAKADHVLVFRRKSDPTS